MTLKKFAARYGTRSLATVLAIFIIWMSLGGSGTATLFTRINYLMYDLRFNLLLPLTKRPHSDHKIAIVDIDEDSIVEVGRFPWSRHKVARLIDKLGEAGVVVIAFDVVFSEAEENPTQTIAQLAPEEVLASFQQDADWQVLASSVDADLHMAQSVGQQDVVLGFFFQDQAQYQNGSLPPPVFTLPEAWRERLVVTDRPGFTANISTLQASATGGGFVTMFPDFDGTVRRAPLVIRHGNELYPSLALGAALRYLFLESIEPKVAEVGDVLTVTEISVSEFPAPTDAQGFVSVPYQGKAYTYPYYSAADVMFDRLEPGVLEGAVVFIGTSAIGLADLRSTPMGPQYPGVEVHANILDALLSGGFPQKPDWSAGAVLLQLVLIAVIMIWVLPRLGPIAMLSGGFVIVLMVVGFNGYVWVLGLDLPLAGALMMTLALTVLFIADGFLRENASKRMLKGMFDQYVPPAHIDKMMSDPDAYTFAGESKEMTVLFSDIRSFTTISESLSAKNLKLMLNTYFTPITKEIFDHNGTIDKYVGDMVMAFWGAPLDDENHRANAVKAALRMQTVTEQLKPMFKAQGLPEVNIGVGVNTGHMNVGDMGSSYRRAYTVLGDSVNLGSRLESITKFYGAKILIGEETYDHITGFVCRFVDRIVVKGKEEAVRVYEPLGLEGEVDASVVAEVEKYHAAYDVYLQRKWAEAKKAFQALYDESSLTLYQVYLERIEDLQHQALPDDWDGTFIHTSK